MILIDRLRCYFNLVINYIVILTAILILSINIAFAEELDLETYKQAYVEQVKPILKKQIATTLEQQEDPMFALDFLANGMADCQVEILEYYPAKYQAATVNPVVKGKGLKQATEDVNELMRQDIEAGEVTREEVVAMVQDSRDHFLKCSKELKEEL